MKLAGFFWKKKKKKKLESVKHTNESNRVCVVYSITAQKTDKANCWKRSKKLDWFCE